MLEIKKTLTETNNAFDVLIRRLDMAGERISALEDIDWILKKQKSKENEDWKQQNT